MKDNNIDIKMDITRDNNTDIIRDNNIDIKMDITNE